MKTTFTLIALLFHMLHAYGQSNPPLPSGCFWTAGEYDVLGDTERQCWFLTPGNTTINVKEGTLTFAEFTGTTIVLFANLEINIYPGAFVVFEDRLEGISSNLTINSVGSGTDLSGITFESGIAYSNGNIDISATNNMVVTIAGTFDYAAAAGSVDIRNGSELRYEYIEYGNVGGNTAATITIGDGGLMAPIEPLTPPSDKDVELNANTAIIVEAGGEVQVYGNLRLNDNSVVENAGLIQITGGDLVISGNGVYRTLGGGLTTISPLITTVSEDPLQEEGTGGDIRLNGNNAELRIDQDGVLQIVSEEYIDGGIQVAGGNLDFGNNGNVYVNGELQIFANTLNKNDNAIFTSDNPPPPPADQPVTEAEFQDYIANFPFLVRIGGVTCDDWDFAITILVEDGDGNVEERVVGIGCNQNDDALPVDLLEFIATPFGEHVLISWQTGSEMNNQGFRIERSYNGVMYSGIGEVDGNGTTEETQSYSWVDKKPLPGIIYYRLVQTDFDGATETFGPVVVQLAAAGEVVRLYPNPLDRGDLTVQLNGFDAGDEATLEIADLSGKTVYAGQFQVSREGADRIIVDLSDRIRRGAYMLRVVQGDRQYTEKLIVTE